MTLTDTTPRQLSADEMARFYRQGYLALRQITDADDLSSIRELLTALFDRFETLPKEFTIDLGDKKQHAGKQTIPQVNQVTVIEPRLKESNYFRNAHAISRQLLGENCFLSFDHAIFKPPHNGKETPWHQDLSYPARSSGNNRIIAFGINFWMPLQDATVESGCMQFIPYSHLGELLPHHPVGNDPDVHTLETDAVDRTKAVACPIPAGGVTMHQPKTLHYTGPNQTDNWRRAWILNFRATLS